MRVQVQHMVANDRAQGMGDQQDAAELLLQEPDDALAQTVDTDDKLERVVSAVHNRAWGFEPPIILDITDYPDDQGGVVVIRSEASDRDIYNPVGAPILGYNIWRWDENGMATKGRIICQTGEQPYILGLCLRNCVRLNLAGFFESWMTNRSIAFLLSTKFRGISS